MEILSNIADAYAFVANLRRSGASVGLVPTMGALHEGHLSLADASASRCDKTLATIFVNPTQFAEGEDLDQYPRTLDADLEALTRRGVSGVFVPETTEMFPESASTFIEPPEIARTLEGEFRPSHFRGVTTVVLKLFHILPATHAFFGQKDYQQLRVIATMVRDLNVPIEIVPCPTVREDDGLAMSSRNRYLTTEQRERALRLSESLRKADAAVQKGERDPVVLQRMLKTVLEADSHTTGVDSIDYATIVDSETLRPIAQIRRQAVALIAAHVGSTRLIDNLVWNDL